MPTKEAIKVEVVRTEHIVAHDTVVDCIGELTFEEWKELGWKLRGAERYCQWYLGWWWNHGHRKWSRDAEAFIEELGYSRQTLQHYGSIYNLVKPCMRMQDLSFNHHQLVAPCEPPEQRKWLEQALAGNWSVAELRKAMRDAEPKPPLPEGVYDVLHADPPWEYSDKLIEGYGAAEHHYECLSVQEVADYRDGTGRPVSDLAEPEVVEAQNRPAGAVTVRRESRRPEQRNI